MQVIEVRKRALGKEYPDTLSSMKNFAFTLNSQDRKEEAFLLLQECFQLRKQVLSEQHPRTMLSVRKVKG